VAVKASDDRLTIRKVTADRRAAWQAAADRDGRELAGWLRHVADQAAEASAAAVPKPRRRRAAA
jgi:hypothetical protein